jgi:hypothetical protein
MIETYNIYCDESCHLLHDRQTVMLLGAIWCPTDRVPEISKDIRQVKIGYNLKADFEIKWTKVSPARLDFYHNLVDYFFKNQDLHFRVLIVPDKSVLQHEKFEQSHDDFYFKMYFDMLKVIISPQSRYRIYLDIKDTRSSQKIAILHDVLCNNVYDFSREIIERVQAVRSHEVEILQLADLLLGAVSYANRNLIASKAKKALVEEIREKSGYQLTKTTLLREDKFNIFRWHATEV